MDYKKAFYSKLEDCYLGARVKEASASKEIKEVERTKESKSTAQNSASHSKRQSGFTNLLHIKEQYFAHIKTHLESRIKALIGNDTIESNDIYNKLYTFFDSYLNETGTPFFTDTPIYKNIYAKIYNNSKDTSLFYKTQNLYYVKSDTLYQSLILQDNLGKLSIFFDASEYKQNADNNKNKVIFKLDCITNGANSTHPLAPSAEGGGTIELHSASEVEQKDNLAIPQITIKVTNQKDLFPDSFNVFKTNSNEFSDDFIKALSDNDLLPKKPTDSHIESLKKLFSSYKKQNEIDFFIHKNAKEFLQEQFDLWMFSYLYKDSAFQQWEEVSIKRLQNVKNLAYEIIDFIATFEDELKAIWLKPKFAKNTQYVFSINTILSNATNANALLASIFSDSHFESQIKEWKELNLVGEDFALSSLQENIANSPSIAEGARGWVSQYKFLPIDTKHLSKESRFALLSAFSDLESLLNGELIKSDNFQALNSIMPKYQGKIDLIYIDPPYNTGNDDFIYADKFNHASWLSMINNRLELSKDILNNKGSIFVSIDDNEQANLKLLMDSVWGEENFVSNSIYEKVKIRKNSAQYFSESHEHILIFANNKDSWKRKLLPRKDLKGYKNPDNDPRGVWIPIPIHANHYYDANYKITKPNGVVLEKPKNQSWRLSEENFKKHIEENRIWWGNGNSYPMIKRFLNEVQDGLVPRTIFYYDETGGNPAGDKALKDIFNDLKVFENPKPEGLIRQIIEIASKENSIILDFFAGSGTTCAVALKLGRKFLGVEMGEHFYKVVLPRLKKVIAGFQSGISKETKYKGGGAFRYYELESYEEALANCEYVLDSPSFAEGDKGGGCSIIDYRKSRKLIKELNKECDKPITLNMSGYRAEFDIFQTIANLMGWKIKQLFLDKTHPLAPSAEGGGTIELHSAREGEKEDAQHTNKKAYKKESIGVESCEYSNGEILNAQNLDIAKYPKLKSLIWWESNA